VVDSTISQVGSTAAPRAAPPARLRAVHPPLLDGKQWTLAQSGCVIGRSPGDEAGLTLEHPTVSRRHLAVEWNATLGSYVCADLGSHNGSSIDGVKLGAERRPLADNAVVRLGSALLVYECTPGLLSAGAPEVSLDALPGVAALMGPLRAQLARAAVDAAPVLIIGETGTGKEWIAGELHRLGRRGGKLVAINCAALSPQLVESQLFGHVRGAFTGASEAQPGLFRAAHGGSLFLDEIGELPRELQPKLLRAIQEGEVQPVGSTQTVRVDVRVIAATHRDLVSAAESGEFRRDLYARLALWELRAPALRQRRVDLLDWIARLDQRRRAARKSAGTPLDFDADAAELLLRNDWPLNLRGLDRLVHELSAEETRPITRAQLPDWLQASAPSTTPAAAPGKEKSPVPTKEEFLAAYRQLDGSVRALSKHFARDRRQIYRWMEAHGLRDKR
jgi:two-component system, NtrC family, response regulator GlrR